MVGEGVGDGGIVVVGVGNCVGYVCGYVYGDGDVNGGGICNGGGEDSGYGRGEYVNEDDHKQSMSLNICIC